MSPSSINRAPTPVLIAPETRDDRALTEPRLHAPASITQPVAIARQTTAFPSPEDAKTADGRLQNTLTQWLIGGRLRANPIAPNSSIQPYTDAFSDAVRAPQVQAWLKSKGLDLSTTRIFNDGVEGTVQVDGKTVIRRFTTTDGSGWWEVGAKVTEAVNALCPDYFGVLHPDESTGAFRHVDVILNFYGVKAPANSRGGPQLGEQLKKDGWPTISDEKRTQWRQQFDQLTQTNSDIDARSHLALQLQALIKDKGPGDELNLSDLPVVMDAASTLAKNSQLPRERFIEWLASPSFKAFVEKIGLGGSDNVYRICEGKLEVRGTDNRWIALHGYLQDEITSGTVNERVAHNALIAGFNQFVELSRVSGNALYSQPIFDAQQLLRFSGLDCPGTVSQVNSAIGWLTHKLPPPPMAGDYAGFTPYIWAPGALSPSNLTALSAKAVGPGSVTHLLLNHLAQNSSLSDHDLQLQVFFDSPTAIAKAQELAQMLGLIEVAGGKALSRARCHQLLATAIKAGATAEIPGKPGVVGGYEIYQPRNLGRTLDEVRSDIEAHLERAGVAVAAAPTIAHLLLAQAGPEFLIKPDPKVSAHAPASLKLSPGQVSIASTAWMNLRLGCAMAEKLAGPGSSRALNIAQAQAFTRLAPMGPAHEQLIKGLGTQPLLDWAVMSGVFPRTSDGRYSPVDYASASQAFADRENSLSAAFQSMTSEPPTQTNVLVEQLAQLFPELTKEQIGNFKLELDTQVPYNPRQHAHLETRRPLLTDVILAQQAKLDPLIALGEWLSHAKKYRFIHPEISQETFNERIKNLPEIGPLVVPAVDKYLADMRTAQNVVVTLMIANAPLEVREGLEAGAVELFTLREETGRSLEQDQGEDSQVAQKIARQGILLRYKKPTDQGFTYLEMFPGSMKMSKRYLLFSRLALDGTVEKRPVPEGPFAYKEADYRNATLVDFDLQAYQTGSEPRPGVRSKAIIEKFGQTLPGQDVPQWSDPAPVYVLNSWASTKTRDIAKAVVDATFDMERERLIEYANQPTKLQRRRSYPFDSGEVLTQKNLRTVLSLIPFVGAIADISDGNLGAGLKGLLIDFASFALTGGLAGARSFYRGLKRLVPFGSRAFTMTELRGASPFFRSLFNPLHGTVDVLNAASKSTLTARRVLAGEVVSLGTGIVVTTTTFEKCRWGLGVYDSLRVNTSAQVSLPYPGSRLGVSQGCALYAVQENAKWYAINPITQERTGAPLEDFTPDAAVR